MEGDTEVTDLALSLEIESGLVSASGLVLLKIVSVLRVHKVKVEVIHSAGFKLAFKKRTDILFFFKVIAGELVCENVGLARIARGKGSLESRLALAFNVSVSRVKIVEARSHKYVYHFGELLGVDLAVIEHGEAHASKSEVLFCFFKGYHKNVSFLAD